MPPRVKRGGARKKPARAKGAARRLGAAPEVEASPTSVGGGGGLGTSLEEERVAGKEEHAAIETAEVDIVVQTEVKEAAAKSEEPDCEAAVDGETGGEVAAGMEGGTEEAEMDPEMNEMVSQVAEGIGNVAGGLCSDELEAKEEQDEEDPEELEEITEDLEGGSSGKSLNEEQHEEHSDEPEEIIDGVGVTEATHMDADQGDNDLGDPEELEALLDEDHYEEDSDEPEEIIDGVVVTEATHTDPDQASDQEVVEEETGNSEDEDTDGVDLEAAGPNEITGRMGDGNANASDDEGDNEENEEEEVDPSVFMHAPLSDRKKQKEFEIFVGGLSKEANEEDLKEVFGKFGEIQAARIVKHPTTQKSKGFAFVRYATAEQAKRALSELKDGVEVKGKHVGISASQDNDTLFMGNICKTWTKDQVLETLKAYGIEQIEELYLPEDPKNEGKIKGFALLEFSTHSGAVAAFQRLKKPDAIFGSDRSAKVSFSLSSMHPIGEALSQVKTVYLESLPMSWDEVKVKEHCEQYGEIEKIQLSRNFSTRRKDFGFISFSLRESALACVEGVNGAQVGEGETKVKANLARPQNKSRLAKQGARGGFKIAKNRGNTEVESNSNKMKSQGKVKKVDIKGKNRPNRKIARGEHSSRSHGKVSGNQGSGFHDRQRRDQQYKSSKHGLDGPYDYNPRPTKRPRGNVQARPMNDFGNRRNSSSGKPKGKYSSRPAPYWDPYAPGGYGASTTSPYGHMRGAVSGTKQQYSDLEPHAGFLVPPANQSRNSYVYEQRSSGGYDKQAGSAGGYAQAGSVGQPSYGTEYSRSGYETAYAYPHGNAAYAPNSRAYPHVNAAYLPTGATYPSSSSGAYPASRAYAPPLPRQYY